MRFRRSRPSPRFLSELRSRDWPGDAPLLSIIMPVYDVRGAWLRQAVESVIVQTYPHWQLICVNDGSRAAHIRALLAELSSLDRRIHVIHSSENLGVSAATNIGLSAARGDYVLFMDHDDFLEPHALDRFADTILRERPDMIYSDEVITGEGLDSVVRVDHRPAFSYDHYLGHPYFVHMVAARTNLVRRLGGLNEEMSISQDVDLNLRLIEASSSICHIPEVLYRWRTHPKSLGHQRIQQCRSMTRAALERHFTRIGQTAVFEDRNHFNYRDVTFRNDRPAHVAVFVVCSGPAAELRVCLASLERTLDASLARIVLLDHRPPGTRSILDADPFRGATVSWLFPGRLNLSALINAGQAADRGASSHYLIVSSRIEARASGWLEHMLTFGQRPDVGVVGALLLGRSNLVHQAGLIIGTDGMPIPALRGTRFQHWVAGRSPGPNGALLASRDVSAVSLDCLLTRADVFRELGGFDERLAQSLQDADYCLRASTLGYRVIHDPYAVLRHHENDSRVISPPARLDDDVRYFRERHRIWIEKGDPFRPIIRDGTGSDATPDFEDQAPAHRARSVRVALPGRNPATRHGVILI